MWLVMDKKSFKNIQEFPHPKQMTKLPFCGFSCNYMYKPQNHTRTSSYNSWLYKGIEYLYKINYDLNGVDINKPMAVYMYFVCPSKFDVDNFTKSMMDLIFGQYLGYANDNNIVSTVTMKIGTVKDIKKAKTYIYFKNI